MQAPLENVVLIEWVSSYYHAEVKALQRLKSDSGKSIYQVLLVDGTSWILSVGEEQDRAAFAELVRLLLFFEQLHYPAERVVRTVEQRPIATIARRQILLTSFLAGTPLPYSPAIFSWLGAAVGRLHALKPLLTYMPAQTKMLPAGELTFARQRLEAIASLVPRRYISQYDFLDQALHSINRGTHLPTTLIHGDCHPTNALLTGPEQITLLDWEEAGLGAAVLDVGFLLANCDGKAPWDSLTNGAFHTEETFLQAVAAGIASTIN